jgi:hypothetical protein
VVLVVQVTLQQTLLMLHQLPKDLLITLLHLLLLLLLAASAHCINSSYCRR